jgi:uncharacterized membrane protein (Fun14 family)
MVTEHMPDSKQPPRRSLGAWLAAMPRWKKIACGAAAACLVGGGVVTLIGSDPAPGTAGGGTPDGMSGSFVPTGTGSTGSGTTAGPAEEPASKGVFRMGFSFFAGFSIGYFVRTTIKVLALLAGAVLLTIFALRWFEIIPPIDWTKVDELWNSFARKVGSETSRFTTFITGSLPAAGLAALGVFAGFKRH